MNRKTIRRIIYGSIQCFKIFFGYIIFCNLVGETIECIFNSFLIIRSSFFYISKSIPIFINSLICAFFICSQAAVYCINTGFKFTMLSISFGNGIIKITICFRDLVSYRLELLANIIFTNIFLNTIYVFINTRDGFTVGSYFLCKRTNIILVSFDLTLICLNLIAHCSNLIIDILFKTIILFCTKYIIGEFLKIGSIIRNFLFCSIESGSVVSATFFYCCNTCCSSIHLLFKFSFGSICFGNSFQCLCCSNIDFSCIIFNYGSLFGSILNIYIFGIGLFSFPVSTISIDSTSRFLNKGIFLIFTLYVDNHAYFTFFYGDKRELFFIGNDKATTTDRIDISYNTSFGVDIFDFADSFYAHIIINHLCYLTIYKILGEKSNDFSPKVKYN